MSGKKWMFSALVSIVGGLLLLSITMFFYDPYNFFSDQDENMYLIDDTTYAISGIINSEEYDFAIVGSSLSLGFDIEYVNEKLNCNAINVSGGGYKSNQKNAVINAIERRGIAQTILCDINIANYSSIDVDTYDQTFPYYLFDNNKVNDIKYLLDYNIWIRMMPRVCATDLMNYTKGNDSHNYFYSLEDFYNPTIWKNQDAEEIIKNVDLSYEKNKFVVKEFNNETKNNIDINLIKIIKENETQKFIFYFPPYSALNWYIADNNGTIEELLAIKEYISAELLLLDNVELYDFQKSYFISNLNYYADETHYTNIISNWIIDCIDKKEYKVELYKEQEENEKLYELIQEFKLQYNMN